MRKTRPFDHVITTGDNFYDPDGVATADNYSEPESCLRRYDGHRWRASWGNHDVEGRSTGSTLGAEHFYAWRLPGIDLIALDSNRAGSLAQREWLKRRLSVAQGPITIVYFHHPPYTVGSKHPNNQTVQRNWVPLFERYDVDLVLTGHAHLYEHHVVDGVDYIVTGGGGRYLHSCAREYASLRLCAAKYHFLLLTIDGTSIESTAILRDGSTLDRVQIDG